jgi:hypothetical protein
MFMAESISFKIILLRFIILSGALAPKSKFGLCLCAAKNVFAAPRALGKIVKAAQMQGHGWLGEAAPSIGRPFRSPCAGGLT